MGKVISIWGSPNSGKTTISVKLAKLLSKTNSVFLVFTDSAIPVIPYIFKEKYLNDLNSKKSLGNILSAPTLSTDVILKNSISIDNKNLGILGYANGENMFAYPRYSREVALEFLNTLKSMVDYIIIDTTSSIESNMLVSTALANSDEVVRLSTPSIKDISYYNSYLPVLISDNYDIDTHINVLSMYMENDAKDTLKSVYNAEYSIEYMDEIREQSLSGELFSSLSKKNEEKMTYFLDSLMFLIDYPEDEDVFETETKKKHLSIFKNIFKRKETN